MVVEWMLGTRERFDWKNGVLIPQVRGWPLEWGLPPVNYGCIPGYWNPNDDAEIDAITANPVPLAVGTKLTGNVLGMIWTNDIDHKIILGEPGDLERLDRAGLEAWFVGRDARFMGEEDALEFIRSLPRTDMT
jgi:inorganic pyrophosphatase